MNASVLSDLASNVSNAAANTALGGNGIIGLALALLCLFLSMLVTWFILRFTLVAYGASPRQSKKSSQGPGQLMSGEGFQLVRLEAVGVALFDAFVAFLTGAINGLVDAISSLFSNWLLLIGLLILSIVARIWLEFHDIIIVSLAEINQCTIRPVLDQTIFPLLNLGRAFFAFAWPFVNAAADVGAALTTGNAFVLFECAKENTSVIPLVLKSLLDGFTALATTFVTFVTTGLLHNGSWEMQSGLAFIGQAINETRPFANCFCLDIDPVWSFLYGLATSPSLAIAIECTVNSGWAVVQIPLTSIINLEAPNSTHWAEEAVCAVQGWGDYAQEVVLSFIEMLIGLLDLVESMIASASVEARSFYYARMKTAHAYADTVLDVPPSVLWMQATPGAAPMRALSMVWMSAANDAIVAGYGKSQAIFPAGGIEDINNDTLILTWGLDALLRVANTQWSRAFTAIPVVVIEAVNITINAIFHPSDAFGSPEGLAYFQFGAMGDATREGVNAVVELLAFFSTSLPCTFSLPLQVLASLPQTFFELLEAVIYASAFPPWQPGVPPPVNCSIVTCAPPPPANWTFLDAVVAYFAWNGSRIRENLVLLEEGGECTAFLLGCNTSAITNNHTNITSNCTDAPLACTARSLNRVLVSLLNLTLSFAFYFPDLVRFSTGYKDFADLPLAATQTAWEDFIGCLGLLIDELDLSGDMCLTPTPPTPEPQYPNTTLPPDPTITLFDLPPRTDWECALDNGAYFWDGRQIVINNASNIFNQNTAQYFCLINETRGCAVAVAHSVEILGSAPEDNITIVAWPDWIVETDAEPLILIYNATTGTLLNTLPNATELEDVYNVTNVNQTNCTRTSRLPDMLGPEYGCDLRIDNAGDPYNTVWMQPFGQNVAQYASNYSFTQFNFSRASCDATLPDSLFCINSNLWINQSGVGLRQVWYQEQPQAMDFPVNCQSNPPTFSDLQVTCRYNALVGLAFIPNEVPVGGVLTLPIYYYIDDPPTFGNTHPIPCQNIPPFNYTCDFGVMQTNGAALLSNAYGHQQNFICQLNILERAPICTRIEISYTTGPETVVVELEGGEVRVYANNTKEAVPCLYGSVDLPDSNETGTITEMSASSTAIHQDQTVLASGEGINFYKMFKWAQQQTMQRSMLRDASVQQPVATRATLDLLQRFGASKLRSAARTMQGAATIPRLQRLISLAGDVHVAAVFRKESFICCFSEAVTFLLTALETAVYSVLFLAQGLLTKPVIPNYPVNLPTFANSTAALRASLCRLACSITELIPFNVSCPGTAGGRCGDLGMCGRFFLCDVFDIPILALEFIVDTLTLIDALIRGTTPTNSILGPTCIPGQPGDCVVSFLVFVVTSSASGFTNLSRTAAGLALAKVAAPSSPCVPVFYTIINPLANLVDGLVSTVLTTFLNFVVGIIEATIYLFSGRFQELGNVLLTKIFGTILILFKNLGNLLLNFLKQLPVIGKVIEILYSVINDSCWVLNKVITLAGGHSLSCPSLGSKRSFTFTGWLNAWPNVTAAWSGEAAASCAARMAYWNSTDLYAHINDTNMVREVQYCTTAYLWLSDAGTDECDIIMTTLYHNGATWPSLDATTQGRVTTCITNRQDAEYVRSAGNSWVPTNLFSGDPRTLAQFADDTMFAFGVWNQYATDRSVPAGQFVSTGYQDAWTAQGYSAAHIASLNASVTTAGDVYELLDNATGNFSIDAYVQRAVAVDNPWRDYAEDRIGGLINAFWRPFMDGTGSPENTNFASYFMKQALDQIEQRIEYATTSIPLTPNIIPRLFAANEPRLLDQTMTGMVDAVAKDIPAMMVRLARMSFINDNTSKRSIMEGAKDVGTHLYNVFKGSLMMAKDFFSGQAETMRTWMQHPVTVEWLSHESQRGRLRDPTGHGAMDTKPTLVGAAASRVVAGLSSLIVPTSRYSSAWSTLMQKAMSDNAASMTSAATRRLQMSRVAARIALIASGQEAVLQKAQENARKPQWARIAQVNNVTGTTCLFTVTNSSNVTTYPFCDTCLALDQILGRIQRSAFNILFFFGVASPSCPGCALNQYPSLNYSITQYLSFYDYITDPNAPVVVGNSPLLPVGYPWQPPLNNWDYWDDPTPNKTGISQLSALISATWDFIRHATNSISTVTTTGPVKVQQARARDWAHRMVERSHGPVHQPMFALQDAFLAEAISWSNATDLHGMVHSAAAQIDPGPFTTLQQVLKAWFDYFLSWILCPFNDLFQNAKHFSIGFVFIYSLIAFFIVACIMQATTNLGLVLVVMVSGTTVTLVALALFLLVTYEYGFLCVLPTIFTAPPALPTGFGDDVLSFLGFSLLPKCAIWYSVVDQSSYDNTNCYSCDNWKSGRWTVPNFFLSFADGGRFGFSDIRMNIAFILKAAYPTIYWQLRPGSPLFNVPGLALFLGSKFIQEPLAAYESFDPLTVSPTTFRQFWNGGTWVTLPANFIIAATLAYLIGKLLWPVLAQTIGFLFSLFLLLFPLVLFLLMGVYVLASYDVVEDQPGPQKKHKKEADRREPEAETDDKTVQLETLLLSDS